MTSTVPSPPADQTVELAPSFNLPIALVLLSVPLVLVQRWAGLAIALFGLFLLYQTATLRLRFTTTDLDVCREETLIRRFPYTEWLNWQIFWHPVPILFYFREVKSIHFLPILFDPKMLQNCLAARISKV